MAEDKILVVQQPVTANAHVPEKKQNDENISNGEILSYGLGGITATMTSQLKSGYHMAFLTEFVGLNAAAVGAWNMILTIWDAVNDPIIGGIADRTRTRWGKYRPHMVIGCILWAVVTMLMFMIPNLSQAGLMKYYIVLLFIWSIFYTQFTVPWQALNSVMSSDVHQRNRLLMVRMLTGTLSATALGMVFIPVVNAVDGGARGYQTMALIVSVCCILFGLIAARGAKKRDYEGSIPNPPKVGFTGQFKTVYKNKAVICVAFLLGFITLTTAIGSATSIYYYTYVVQNLALLSITSLLSMVSSFIYLPFMPKIMKKFGKIKSLLLGSIINMVGPVLLILFRENLSVPLILVTTLASTIGAGMANTACVAFVPDCTDYTELHFGSSQAGFINSMITFMKKFCSSFSSLIVGVSLTAAGYAKGVGVTPDIVNTILDIKIFIPIALFVLILIVIRIYPITTQYGIEMRAKLKEMRATRSVGRCPGKESL